VFYADTGADPSSGIVTVRNVRLLIRSLVSLGLDVNHHAYARVSGASAR
jgi:hypothetical protein